MAQENSKPYDHITIQNAVDGTTIQGHEAVSAYFKREEQLLKKHGSFLFFQIYRINMQAKNFKDLQGNMLMEFKVNPNLISGTDTVAAVKNKIYPSLQQHSKPLNLKDTDKVTFVFGGSRMNEHRKFYADHFMMLPAWVQVFLHQTEFEEILDLVAKF